MKSLATIVLYVIVVMQVTLSVLVSAGLRGPTTFWLCWCIPIALFVYLTDWTFRYSRGGEIVSPAACPECRYDLRGLPGTGTCPECGSSYQPAPREQSFQVAMSWKLGRLLYPVAALTVASVAGVWCMPLALLLRYAACEPWDAAWFNTWYAATPRLSEGVALAFVPATLAAGLVARTLASRPTWRLEAAAVVGGLVTLALQPHDILAQFLRRLRLVPAESVGAIALVSCGSVLLAWGAFKVGEIARGGSRTATP